MTKNFNNVSVDIVPISDISQLEKQPFVVFDNQAYAVPGNMKTSDFINFLNGLKVTVHG